MPGRRRRRPRAGAEPVRRTWLPALALAVLAAAPASPARPAPVAVSPATDAAQAGMVEVRALAPDIAEDIRYAGHHNFTGRPVPGYAAPACYLLRPAAQALARVQAALRAQGYGLQMFDCYRPVTAVRAFVAWVADPDDQVAKAEFYPGLDKSVLIAQGYIADRSGHSRGATVDLGLLDCRAGPCVPLDMGTGFDFFGPRAHTDAPGLAPAQRANRQRLVQAMAAAGFANYDQEWWHYTLMPEPTPHTAYDFPVIAAGDR